jgi:hypothetical protein
VSVAAERARALMHDVGKQVARTARNLRDVGEGPLPSALLRMLIADLYALPRGADPDRSEPGSPGIERASARLARLARGLDDPRAARHLDDARAALSTLDAIESEVRANEPAAVARAVELARSVEIALRALLAEVDP